MFSHCENCIPTVVNLYTKDLFDCFYDQMINKYLTNPDYSFDKVNQVSVACEPLVKWATPKVNYADLLKRVEALRNELRNLDQADVNKKSKEDTTDMTAQL